MTLPWQDWSNCMGYKNKKSMLKGMYKKHKSIRKMADKIGVEPQVIKYHMEKECIDYIIKPPGGPNNTGPNYKELKWITDTIPKETLETMTVREMIDASGKEYSRHFRHSLYRRLLDYGIKYKKGKMGRPKTRKHGEKRHNKN